jgi:predicted DNA binding CopG/RHH family protein
MSRGYLAGAIKQPKARGTTSEVDVKPEHRLDDDELRVLAAYDAGEFVSIPSKDELEVLRAAARATGTKDRRVNIRRSSADVRDIQALALREGIPYQKLISSILHEYVTGRLVERG